MPNGFEPWVVMMLPPGGFFMIGVLLLGMNWRDLRSKARALTARAPAVKAAAPAGQQKEPEAVLV